MLSEIKDRVRTIEEYLVHTLRGLYNLPKTNKLANLSTGQFNNLRSIRSFCSSSSTAWNLIILLSLVTPAVSLEAVYMDLPLIHSLMR